MIHHRNRNALVALHANRVARNARPLASPATGARASSMDGYRASPMRRYNKRLDVSRVSRGDPSVTHPVTQGGIRVRRLRQRAISGGMFDAEGWPSGRWRWS